MTTFRALALIPAALVILIACSDDSSQANVTAAPPKTTEATTRPVVSGPATSDPATSEPAGSTTVPEGPIQIDVLVGTDDSPTRVENVRLGSSVTINVTDPAAADEFHLHGYDIEQAVDADVTATFNFDANQAGAFELESHNTGNVLLILQVG